MNGFFVFQQTELNEQELNALGEQLEKNTEELRLMNVRHRELEQVFGNAYRVEHSLIFCINEQEIAQLNRSIPTLELEIRKINLNLEALQSNMESLKAYANDFVVVIGYFKAAIRRYNSLKNSQDLSAEEVQRVDELKHELARHYEILFLLIVQMRAWKRIMLYC